ncbi:hypothetical protein [Nonomuraea turkmeniaca]|uniref:hypothetical protein n=1 Tax=Nonomuraea turkmeniaca TaxID=103838 RepID=UPI001B87F781|nr:hypothetical protein [Nonomuraea turkmeniaca]
MVALAALTATVLAFPRAVPNGIGHLGSLVETFLPWLALIVPVLLGLAWWRRSAVSALAALLPTATWLSQFGGHVLPARTSRIIWSRCSTTPVRRTPTRSALRAS